MIIDYEIFFNKYFLAAYKTNKKNSKSKTSNGCLRLFIIKRKIMEKKGVFWWIIFILSCIWQLPQTLVGLIMMPFMGKMKKVADRHFNFCWEATNMMGGISLGPIAFVSRGMSEEAIAHETDGHTKQSLWEGPLYLLITGIPSLIHAWLYDYKKHCYYDFFCEKWANDLAGLEVDEKCRLHFKNKQ